MTTGISLKIMKALFSGIQDVGLPIAWPDDNFTIPADGKYLQVNFIPNTTTRFLIDSDGPQRHIGILQVSVVWPLLSGEEAHRTIADQVCDMFLTDQRLVSGDVSVRITQRPEVGPMIAGDREAMIPVSVYYESFA